MAVVCLLAGGVLLPPGVSAATKASSKKSPAAGARKKAPPKTGKAEGPRPETKPAASPPAEEPKPAAENGAAKNGAEGDGGKKGFAPNASVAPEDIREFAAQPAGVRRLIESGLALTRRGLTYTYGSADPAKGGMDCSGFIHFVLRQHGLTDVPRDSSGLYLWVRKERAFRAVMSRRADSVEFDELLPGDLLFWTGTYAVKQDPPVTHTMLYLGTEKSTGARIMVGSSDGRSYRGQRRNGVSVFDFTMPRPPADGTPGPAFVGYARIPGLRE